MRRIRGGCRRCVTCVPLWACAWHACGARFDADQNGKTFSQRKELKEMKKVGLALHRNHVLPAAKETNAKPHMIANQTAKELPGRPPLKLPTLCPHRVGRRSRRRAAAGVGADHFDCPPPGLLAVWKCVWHIFWDRLPWEVKTWEVAAVAICGRHCRPIVHMAIVVVMVIAEFSI